MEDKSKPGEVTKLVAGDILHVDHESYSTFVSPNNTRSSYLSALGGVLADWTLSWS